MERRRAPRRTIAEAEPLAQARLRTGGQLRVLDASSWGALTETHARLLPGRHLDVHVTTPAGRILVRGRVARAYVYSLHADAIHYRAALAFDQVIDAREPGYSLPGIVLPPPPEQGSAYPESTHTREIEFVEPLSV